MVKFQIQQVGEVLQKLFDSGISLKVETYFSEGFDWVIGTQGCFAFSHGVNTGQITLTIDAIAFRASELYPESNFAEWYKGLEAEVAAQLPPLEFINYRGNCISNLIS